MIQRIFLFLFLIFGLAACNRDVSIQPNSDGTATITVSVTEQEVNTLITTALSNNRNPLLRNPSVDLQNGQIIISGEHDKRDGSGRVSGSVTLTANVVNGALQVQISSVNVEGWDANDSRIQEFNDRIAQALSGRARQNNSNATLDSVTISNDALQIQITVSR